MNKKGILLGVGIISIVGLLSVSYAHAGYGYGMRGGNGYGMNDGYHMMSESEMYDMMGCDGYMWGGNNRMRTDRRGFREIKNVEDARKMAEFRLYFQNNPNLKVDDIKETKDEFIVKIVTKKEEAEVETLQIDKQTGRFYRK